jgi:hypothetical protein
MRRIGADATTPVTHRCPAVGKRGTGSNPSIDQDKGPLNVIIPQIFFAVNEIPRSSDR